MFDLNAEANVKGSLEIYLNFHQHAVSSLPTPLPPFISITLHSVTTTIHVATIMVIRPKQGEERRGEEEEKGEERWGGEERGRGEERARMNETRTGKKQFEYCFC